MTSVALSARCGGTLSPSGTAKKYTSARSIRPPTASRSPSVIGLYALSPSPRNRSTCCRPRFGWTVARALSNPVFRPVVPAAGEGEPLDDAAGLAEREPGLAGGGVDHHQDVPRAGRGGRQLGLHL